MKSIDKKNAPILKWKKTHPARVFLEMHSHFSSECIGCEFAKLQGGYPVDQVWESESLTRKIKFSDVLYKYISFTPVLTEWLENAGGISDREVYYLKQIAECRILIYEAVDAAEMDNNCQILKNSQRALDLLLAWENSILARQD